MNQFNQDPTNAPQTNYQSEPKQPQVEQGQKEPEPPKRKTKTLQGQLDDIDESLAQLKEDRKELIKKIAQAKQKARAKAALQTAKVVQGIKGVSDLTPEEIAQALQNAMAAKQGKKS